MTSLRAFLEDQVQADACRGGRGASGGGRLPGTGDDAAVDLLGKDSLHFGALPQQRCVGSAFLDSGGASPLSTALPPLPPGIQASPLGRRCRGRPSLESASFLADGRTPAFSSSTQRCRGRGRGLADGAFSSSSGSFSSAAFWPMSGMRRRRAVASCRFFGGSASCAGEPTAFAETAKTSHTGGAAAAKAEAARAEVPSKAARWVPGPVATDRAMYAFLMVSQIGSVGASFWLGAKRREREARFQEEEANVAGDLLDVRSGQTATSMAQIWGITSPSICFGFMASNLVMLAFPLEAQALSPAQPSAFLGAIGVAIAASMPVGPISGRYSDSLKHPLGRRRPLVILAVTSLIDATSGMWFCSRYHWRAAFLTLTFVQQFLVHTAGAAAAALLADMVDPAFSGAASGVHTANALAGGILGILVFHGVALVGADYHWNYLLFSALNALVLPIFVSAADEVDSYRLELPAPLDWSNPSASLGSIFRLNWEASPNFALVIQERALYNCGTTYKAYLLFAVRDLLFLDSLKAQTAVVARTAFIAEGAAVFAALLSSLLAHQQVLRPQIAAATGAILMGVAGQFWLVTFVPDPVSRMLLLDVQALLYGTGQGMYLAGDMSLTLKTVPDVNESNRYLSLAHAVSTFVGGCAGGIGMAVIMEVFGRRLPETFGVRLKPGAYHLGGYASSMLAALSVNFAAASLALKVRTPAELENPQEEDLDNPQEF
eukprot:TRINITY_DN24392_c0_g3_i1.p1 TRINITY_DN24392_c0_g3~~TRINITY_DN24392_c0_g3_i1.p1  ORF type:complete len:718 (+),score=134.98 TRINITY_DN24392_c0_g3_i1:132-2285(+)